MPQELKRYAALFETSPKLMGKKRNRNNVWIPEERLDLCDKRRTMKPNRDKIVRFAMSPQKVWRDLCAQIELGLEIANLGAE